MESIQKSFVLLWKLEEISHQLSFLQSGICLSAYLTCHRRQVTKFYTCPLGKSPGIDRETVVISNPAVISLNWCKSKKRQDMQTFRPPYHSASVSSTLAKLEVTSVFPTAICELNLCFLGLDRCTKYTKPSKTESKLVEKDCVLNTLI